MPLKRLADSLVRPEVRPRPHCSVPSLPTRIRLEAAVCSGIDRRARLGDNRGVRYSVVSLDDNYSWQIEFARREFTGRVVGEL